MTRDEMDTLISAAIVSAADRDGFIDEARDVRVAFVAGMRAAADLADTWGRETNFCEDPVETIRIYAHRLETGVEDSYPASAHHWAPDDRKPEKPPG